MDKNITVFADVNFWINSFIGLFAFVASFIIGFIKRDIDRARNEIKELYGRTETNNKDIGIIAKDLENLRDECERNHAK